MDVLKFPHPSLFKKGQSITVFGNEIKLLLDAMWETMIAHRGMGLSANQVDLPFNMFVMEGPNKEKFYIVNPKIVEKSTVRANLEEGCLSAPGEFLIIDDRSDSVLLEYQNETGESLKRTFNSIYAVCIQHEMEHLQGKGFMESKSIPKNERKRLAKRWGFK